MDEGPGEHDAHLMDDDLEETVPCAHCGREVWAYAQRCPQCGTHFSGEAWQFQYQDGGRQKSGRSWRWLVVVLLLVLAMLFITLW